MIIVVSAISTAIDPTAISAQAATPANTLVSTELINYYSMTNSEIQTFMTTLHNQRITTLTLRINSYNEFTSNSNTAIAKIKTIIPVANAQGISINVDLHTWFTTWDNNFRDSASNAAANRDTYINYVKTTLTALNGYNVNAFMVLNEPQARTASTSENNFILRIISAANSVTNKPISVRFMAGYSPSTGHYSSAIDQANDFLSRNTYWDPRNPTASVYGCTETKLLNALSTAQNQNKQLWITEFGKSNSNLAEQQAYVRAFVAYTKSKGMDQIFCWVSQPESSGETYNIFNGYNPNPAFYELVNSAVVNPSPSPTPTATTTPAPTQTPTPTPSPTQPPTSNVIFEDNFESRDLHSWSDTTTTSGDSVTSADYVPYNGNYHARFYTSGSSLSTENAYLRKNVNLQTATATGQFRISRYQTTTILNDNGDRLYFIRFANADGDVASAGIKRENGVNKWVLQTNTVQTTSTINIGFDQYYSIALYWNAAQHKAEMYVNGQKILESNTASYGTITTVDMGIISAYKVQNPLILYGDNFIISRQ
jgi:hypothetical protein